MLTLLGVQELTVTGGTHALAIPAGTKAVLVGASGAGVVGTLLSIGGVPLTETPRQGSSNDRAIVAYADDISGRSADTLVIGSTGITMVIRVHYVGGNAPTFLGNSARSAETGGGTIYQDDYGPSPSGGEIIAAVSAQTHNVFSADVDVHGATVETYKGSMDSRWMCQGYALGPESGTSVAVIRTGGNTSGNLSRIASAALYEAQPSVVVEGATLRSESEPIAGDVAPTGPVVLIGSIAGSVSEPIAGEVTTVRGSRLIPLVGEGIETPDFIAEDALTPPTIEWGEAGDISTLEYDDTPLAGSTGRHADAGHRHGMPSASGGGGAGDSPPGLRVYLYESFR
jgi:hypothetical protein